MEERVEDCMREQKFEMYKEYIGFSSDIAHDIWPGEELKGN